MVRRGLGGLLLLSGLFLFYLAYQGSQTFGDETRHFFTGDYRQRTYWLIGSGAVLVVAAVVGLVVPVRRRPFFS